MSGSGTRVEDYNNGHQEHRFWDAFEARPRGREHQSTDRNRSRATPAATPGHAISHRPGRVKKCYAASDARRALDFYSFVAMATLALPVMGVPLAFVSYGGTLLLSLSIGMGILVGVQAHRKIANS